MIQTTSVSSPQSFICALCFQHEIRFLPIKGLQDQLKTQGFAFPLDSIETLSYDTMLCDHCESSDRARLLAHTLRQHILPHERKKPAIRIHDVNPEGALSLFCQNHPQIQYSTGALEQQSDRMDVIICLHYLENQENDKSIIENMTYKLKKEGEILAISPIALTLKQTLETKDYEKQEDKNKFLILPHRHKRLYAKKDFIALFTKYKLQAKQYTYQHLHQYFGLSKTATLYGFKN